MNYRKIYEQYHGNIPVDNDGNTYDIHHKDGNRANNCIENLQAVSLKQHYDIHFEKGQFGACHGILLRSNTTTLNISNIASINAKKRVENGTHHFLDKKAQSIRGKKAANSGKTPKFTKDNKYQIKAQKTLNTLKEKKMHPFQLHNSSKIIWSCEYCNKTGKGTANYSRYHGRKCKQYVH